MSGDSPTGVSVCDSTSDSAPSWTDVSEPIPDGGMAKIIELLEAPRSDINDMALCYAGCEMPDCSVGADDQFVVFTAGRCQLFLRRALGLTDKTFAGAMPTDHLLSRISKLIETTRGKHTRYGRCTRAPFTITFDDRELKVAPTVRPIHIEKSKENLE